MLKSKDGISIYKPKYPKTIVYMLQATEYNIPSFLSWVIRTKNFSTVMHRKALVMTRPARLLLAMMWMGMLAQVALGVYLGYRSYHIHQSLIGPGIIILFLLATPIVWTYLIVSLLLIGRWLVIKPYYRYRIKKSEKIFATHKGAKIAIAGSYGKTTMKEILFTIFSEGMKVAATPGNRNVAISHAQFSDMLAGDEDILIIEYGEGAPGDVARFAKNTHPDIGIITGIAPAHLDKYKTLKAVAEDIFSLQEYVTNKEVYVNSDSHEALAYITKDFIKFSSSKVDGWDISHIKVAITGTSFRMSKAKRTLKINTQLIGKHLVGPIALSIYLADEAGIGEEQIINGVKKLKAFEHRMQARQFRGAWIIDDTYNGNIEGMLAGLELLKKLSAKNKIYVTPGLVDQGDETVRVHLELGRAMAKANPDLVVLMQNSVCEYIEQGLKASEYKGKLRIENDPLEFYTNIEHFVASGDLVLMQNDWPDNYA